jgi:hypothetical protein
MGKKKVDRARCFGFPRSDYDRRLKYLEAMFKCDFPGVESGHSDIGQIRSEKRFHSRHSVAGTELGRNATIGGCGPSMNSITIYGFPPLQRTGRSV